jgi:hypothetical protein
MVRLKSVASRSKYRVGGDFNRNKIGVAVVLHLAARIRGREKAVLSRLELGGIECFVGFAGVSNNLVSRLDFSSPLG